jgi:hypothetical protein
MSNNSLARGVRKRPSLDPRSSILQPLPAQTPSYQPALKSPPKTKPLQRHTFQVSSNAAIRQQPATAMKLPPISYLRHFAKLLGWEPLARWTHRIPEHERRDGTLPRLVVWYESGDFDDLKLQINISSVPHAAVYAPRYRLCSLWHHFELGTNAKERRAEAEQLDGWLHRRWFERPAMRRDYRLRHPECCGWSTRRIREECVPRLDANGERW